MAMYGPRSEAGDMIPKIIIKIGIYSECIVQYRGGKASREIQMDNGVNNMSKTQQFQNAAKTPKCCKLARFGTVPASCFKHTPNATVLVILYVICKLYIYIYYMYI